MSAVHFDRDGNGLSPRCGNRDWSQMTSDEAGVDCLTCLNLMAGVHGTGNRKADPEPCGTPAAYRRHLRHDGKPVRCERCLKAESSRGRDDVNERRREQYAVNRAAGMSAREANRRRDLRRAA
jgi:hypothetical protein